MSDNEMIINRMIVPHQQRHLHYINPNTENEMDNDLLIQVKKMRELQQQGSAEAVEYERRVDIMISQREIAAAKLAGTWNYKNRTIDEVRNDETLNK